MSQLLRGRYLPFTDRGAWDLATGHIVPIDAIAGHAPDAGPAIPSLVEALQHGQDGAPRWLVAQVAPAGCDRAIRRAADDATGCGYVPISVEVFHRLRGLLGLALQDRALLLIAGRRTVGVDPSALLVEAAAASPRPHLLLTIRGGAAERTSLVREARAVYAVPAAGARTTPRLHGDAIGQLQRLARAALLIKAGRHAAADRLLRDAAAALARRNLHGYAATALIAAGRLALERGRPPAADALFEEAASSETAGKDEALVATARLWQAAARTDAAQLTGAEALCRAVLVTSRVDAPWRPIAEATLARVLLWQGRLDEALQLQIVEQGADDPHEPAFVSATVVRLLLAGGRIFEAGQRARHLEDAAARMADDLPGRIIAATAQLRVLTAGGDLTLAEARFREVLALSHQAHVPLRAARARLLWVEALRRAGRSVEAERQLRVLTRVAAAAPPLMRRAIARCVHPDRRVMAGRADQAAPPVSAAGLVQICNAEERDADGIGRLLDAVRADLRACRVEICSALAGPVSTMLGSGGGSPTGLGARVLEAGIAIGPEPGGREVAVPVRLGARLLGALVARWPADRSCPASAQALLVLAAAIVAPRLEAMQATAVEIARAATAVPELLGVSAAMNEVRRAIARAAAAPFAVMVEGESGVGKELVARAIHQLSARRQRRFCDVNCAALPDDLFEAELFGHARGAFTGAVAERPGLFEEADGGTLFLDEVADLSARAQAKLLRVLQQHEVRRVGESFSRKIDVRVVAAANRDMRDEAAAGRFRHDLLYRLDVIRLRIPPLRERPEDIAVLAAHFWVGAAARVGSTAALTHGVLAALSACQWPGNVRELQNAIAALAVAAPSRGVVRASLLPAAIAGNAGIAARRLAEARTLFERRFVEAALARAGGSRTRAARELGVSRQGLAKLLTRLQLTGAPAAGDDG